MGSPAPAQAKSDTPGPDKVAARFDRKITGTLQRMQKYSGQELPLADLREQLVEVSPQALDAQLRRMSKEGKIVLMPHPKRSLLRHKDHAAAIRVGGEENHIIVLRSSG
jgi:hypothetical protein